MVTDFDLAVCGMVRNVQFLAVSSEYLLELDYTTHLTVNLMLEL